MFSFFNYFNIIFADIPENWGFTFQDPASPLAEGIINFHHDIFFYLLFILVLVLFYIIQCMRVYNITYSTFSNTPFSKYSFISKPKAQKHIPGLEILWTVFPSLILFMLVIPSFTLLYSLDEIINPSLTVKVIGHQWYWVYEKGSTVIESYIVLDNETQSNLKLGDFRLLEVDNRLVLPVKTHVRLLITAADVIHSFAIPSLGIKVDAVPGRINQEILYSLREGVFYGQCSELCGVNHGFMPIVVEIVNKNLI